MNSFLIIFRGKVVSLPSNKSTRRAVILSTQDTLKSLRTIGAISAEVSGVLDIAKKSVTIFPTAKCCLHLVAAFLNLASLFSVIQATFWF